MAEEEKKEDKKEEEQNEEQNEEQKEEQKDDSDSSGDKVAGALNKAKEGLKKVADKIKQVGSKVAKNLLKNPLFWKILLIALAFGIVVMLIYVIVAAIISLFTYNPFNPSKGTMSSLYGMNGDSFYGARLLYKDDEKAAQEIIDSYKKFTYQLLCDVEGTYGEGENAYTVTLNVSDISQKENSEVVKTITQTYAVELAKDYVAEGETAPSTLEDSAKIIDHFGLTSDEVTFVIGSVVDSLKSDITVKIGSNNATQPTNDQVETFKGDLANKVNTKASSMPIYKQITTPCDKIFVCDYFLKDETSGLEDLEKHNYIAMVYMAKKDVEIYDASYRFLVEGEEKILVELKSKINGQISSLGPQTEVDASWYQDEEFENYEVDEINITLKQFTALNSSNQTELSQPQTLNSLIANNVYSLYFNQPESNGSNVSYLSTQDNPINWISLINADNFMFLECQAAQAFLMAEFNVEYE